MAAPDREQLKIELQQVNQQINQQTQMRSIEVCVVGMYKISWFIFNWVYTLIWLMQEKSAVYTESFCIFSCVTGCQ